MEDMKELLKSEFRNDPLFLYIQQEDLEFELFNDEKFYTVLRKNSSYSTKEAASILGLGSKDWTIRNYLNRYDLDSYVQVGKMGSQMVLDYDSMFRFKMIFLLKDLKGKKPIDIANIVGTVATEFDHVVVKSTSDDFNNAVNNSVGTVGNDSATQLLLLTNLNQQKDKLFRQIDEIQTQQKNWEKDMRDITDKITLIEHTKFQHKLQKEQQVKLIDELESKNKKTGLFSVFSKNSKLDLSEVRESILNENSGEELELQYSHLIDRREELEKIKETILVEGNNKIKTYQQQLSKLDDKVGQIYQNINQNDELFSILSSIQFIDEPKE